MNNNSSRVSNSIKNIINGLLSQCISVVLSFIVRSIFIKYLNEEFLGINGLFTNILTVLSLAELGFGTAMVYSMYKPLADNNKEKIKALMFLYKKVYIVIGIIVCILGIVIIPFMDYIIKDTPNISNLTFIYIMFLMNSVFSYFFAYKRSILSADQKEYICSQYRYIFVIIKSLLQICVLVIFKDFILYLLMQIVCTVMENIFISKKVDKLYPFLKDKNTQKLDKKELSIIKTNVKALIISKISNIMLNGTDNIIISSIVGVAWVGLLSNYTLITGALVMILSQIFSALTGSVGNFMAMEEKENRYELFNVLDLINYWIYGFSAMCLVILLNPFIELWIGKEYLLSEETVIIIAINFMINGMLSTMWIFRSTMGLFKQGQYRSIMVSVLNIVVSIILGKHLGLLGVLLGTTISRVLVNLWYDPYVIFKYGFSKSVKKYYIKYLFRVITLVLMYIIISCIKEMILYNGNNLILFLNLLGICIIIINLIIVITNIRTKEFKYISQILNNLLLKLKRV